MPPKKIQVKSKSKIPDKIDKIEDNIIKVEKLDNPKQSIIKSNIKIIEPKMQEQEQDLENPARKMQDLENPARKPIAKNKDEDQDLENLEDEEDQDLENPERKEDEDEESEDTIVKSMSNDIDNLEKEKTKKNISKLEKLPEKLPNKDKQKVSEKKKDKESSKDKDSRVHNHSKPKTITASTKDVNTVDMFGEDDLDFRYVMMNYDYTKNTTMPKITKYEKALLIGKRAKQIEEGANPNVKYTSGQSVISIAEEELRQRKIPLIIKRPIGNKFEYWKPADMEVNMD